MPNKSKTKLALLCAASTVALTSGAQAQNSGLETVTVTGSLVITSIVGSPTPLTVVTTDMVQSTTPGNLVEGLDKLPVFIDNSTTSTPNGAGGNAVSEGLSLRNFGSTLFLFDGIRTATGNTDVLPQMLVKRVDIVTAGASAVYGSDATTGVVNYVIDKDFSGVKFNTGIGVSRYGDGMKYQLGAAYGSDLFGGHGHFEGELRFFHQDAILLSARPWGATNWVSEGSGTAANPYKPYEYGTLTSFAWGGKIACTGCAANGQQFVSDGVLGPFNLGTALQGTTTVTSGGDGVYDDVAPLSAALTEYESFNRFSYDLSDTITAWGDLTYAESHNFNTFTDTYIQTNAAPNTFMSNNPFLTPAAQAALTVKPGVVNTFVLTEYVHNPAITRGFLSYGNTRNFQARTGLQGTNLFGRFDWDVYYTHAESRLHEHDPVNMNTSKMFAAEDAVVSGGQIVCYVSTTTFANLYPGCVPMNPFGPTAMTATQLRYVESDTSLWQNTHLDDFGGKISSKVMDLPAGPLNAGLSFEARETMNGTESTALAGTVNCTGLRLCNTTESNYEGATSVASPNHSQFVWEFAGEVNVPLLAELPLVKDLSADFAGRFTHYTVSGAVQTWKIGGVWGVNDDVRFRATTSVDIRAPSTSQLYGPTSLNHGGFTDNHTNSSQNALTVSQSNSNLVPETSRTYTAGVVFTPQFIPGLTMTADYYAIDIQNAIVSISGTSTGIQQVCEASNGTSPLCALFVRPLPFSDHTAANYPTEILSESVNAGVQRVGGLDNELDYSFDTQDIVDGWPGSWTARVLSNWQPYQDTALYPGAATTLQNIPKWRVTTFLKYDIGSWSFNLGDRYFSSFPRSTQPTLVFWSPARDKWETLVDLTIDKTVVVDDNSLDLYWSITNLLDTPPPIEPGNMTVPGLYAYGYQPASGNRVQGVDNIGRFFMIGIRAKL